MNIAGVPLYFDPGVRAPGWNQPELSYSPPTPGDHIDRPFFSCFILNNAALAQ